MMVLEGVGWDKKEFSKSNIYVYGRDDTKIIVYNMENGHKRRGLERKTLENNPLNTGNCVHQ